MAEAANAKNEDVTDAEMAASLGKKGGKERAKSRRAAGWGRAKGYRTSGARGC